jgi:hypothetical protein
MVVGGGCGFAGPATVARDGARHRGRHGVASCSTFTVRLLQIGYGLVIAGGLLLLWVCWKLWRELRAGNLTVRAE